MKETKKHFNLLPWYIILPIILGGIIVSLGVFRDAEHPVIIFVISEIILYILLVIGSYRNKDSGSRLMMETILFILGALLALPLAGALVIVIAAG